MEKEKNQRSPSPKRKRNLNEVISVNMDNSSEDETPKYLMMKKDNGDDFSKDNPFFIFKSLKSLISFKNVSKTRDGLLIQCERSVDSKILLSTKTFGQYQVSVEAHSSLNISKGVVTCRDLLMCSTDEIKDELKPQRVTDVKRITTRRNGTVENTASLILTFSTPKLPSTVTAGYHLLRVRQYVPQPLRCFRCQKFGHVASRCTKDFVCICGRPKHDGSPCVEPYNCVNCSGAHVALSRQCPMYKTEFAIQELKVRDKLSYNEARRQIVGQGSRRSDVTYAQVASTFVPKPTPSPIDIDQLVQRLLPALITAIVDRLPGKLSTTQPSTEPQVKPTPVSVPEQPSVSSLPTASDSSASDMDANDIFDNSQVKIKQKFKTSKKSLSKLNKHKINS